jgi:hypothetical protein
MSLIVVDPLLTREQSKKQLLETCVVAAHLLLYPEYVFNTTMYWLSQYNNFLYVEREEETFNDFIAGILRERPSLRLTASEAIAHQSYYRLSYAALLQFVGTPCHAIPLEYFAKHNYDMTLFESLANLVAPHEKCFLSRHNSGLDGELALGAFRYDYVLEHFYEPSFIILTAYVIHLMALMQVTEGHDTMDFIPRHVYSLKAINEDALQQAQCLSDAQRMMTMQHELRQLYKVLNQSNLDLVLRQCFKMWEEKATYCYEQMFIRRDTLVFGNAI